MDSNTDAAVSSSPNSNGERPNDLDRVATIMFTSGTSTGHPKGCPVTERNLMTMAVNECAIPDLTDTYLAQTASFRAIYNFVVIRIANCGGHVIMPSASFSAATTLDAIEKCKSDMMMICVPAQIRMLANEPSLKSRGLSSMKRVSPGGDIITSDVVEQARKIFTAATVTPGHGMTEGSGVLGNFGGSANDPIPVLQGIETLLKPAPGANVRIVDSDGKVLKRGEFGALHLGGPSMISRYWDDVQPEAFYRDHRGNWIVTGDRAVMQEAGNVFIVGRVKDIVKRAGVSLSPAVIESAVGEGLGCQVQHYYPLDIPLSANGELGSDSWPPARDAGRSTSRYCQ